VEAAKYSGDEPEKIVVNIKYNDGKDKWENARDAEASYKGNGDENDTVYAYFEGKAQGS